LFVDAEKLLHRKRVSNIVGERREIIEAIGVRNELGVGHVLGDFFIAAMQIADIGNGLGDDLAIEFEDDAKNAVSGGMGWPHVEDHFFAMKVFEFVRPTNRLTPPPGPLPVEGRGRGLVALG